MFYFMNVVRSFVSYVIFCELCGYNLRSIVQNRTIVQYQKASIIIKNNNIDNGCLLLLFYDDILLVSAIPSNNYSLAVRRPGNILNGRTQNLVFIFQ